MNLGLSGQKREELQYALLDAFPSKASLKKMLTFELNKNLDEITTDANLKGIIFNLIKTADSQNWIEDLINAALNRNPENSKLKAIAKAIKLNKATVNSHNQTKNRSGQSNTKQVNHLVLKLHGISSDQFLSDKEIQSTMSLLFQKADCNPSLNIEKVEDSSIKITNYGTPQGLEKLADLIQSGDNNELKEIEELGLYIEDAKLILESAQEENKSTTKTFSPKNINIRQNPITTKQVFANLIRGNLVGAFRIFRNLSRANLNGADLSRADLSRAKLSHADLSRAKLSHADLSRAKLSHADLSRAKLSHADLNRAKLSHADLNRAKLSRANLSRADLSRADLSSTNLSRANLSSTNLSRADLSFANLSSANLSRANLSRADLSGTELNFANVKNARFEDNQGISSELKLYLIQRGAIFEDSPGDREAVIIPR